MWVTCYTDASYSPMSGGAWGVWLRSNLGRLKRHGRCPDYVRNSIQAELAAIFAGVHLSLARWGAAVEGILIRSDSQGALVWLEPDRPPARDKALRKLQSKIHEAAGTHGVTLSGRWVKGHQKTGSLEAFLNNQCDKMARKRRRSPRRKQG